MGSWRGAMSIAASACLICGAVGGRRAQDQVALHAGERAAGLQQRLQAGNHFFRRAMVQGNDFERVFGAGEADERKQTEQCGDETDVNGDLLATTFTQSLGRNRIGVNVGAGAQVDFTFSLCLAQRAIVQVVFVFT